MDKNRIYSILIRPSLTERSFKLIQEKNTIVFLVDISATKIDIKKAVEQAYNVKVAKVNTLITMESEKRAFVKLTDQYKATDLSVKLKLF